MLKIFSIQLMTQITHGMKQELQRERINGQIKNMKLNLIILQKYYQGIGSDITNTHPAILGLCEVENRQVLIDLVSTDEMKDLSYGIIHFDSKDWRGIDVALLFDTTKFIHRKAKTYPLKVEYRGKPSFSRDVLVVFGFFEKELLI